MSGWIKLHRSFLEFDWYDDANVVRLLLHLILTCNYEQKQWRGQEIHQGQLVTSYDKLADALSISNKAVRIALEKLEKGGEITRERAGKGQLVTLVKWGKFQGEGDNEGRKRAGNGAGKGQEKGRQEGRKRATTKEIEEDKEVKKVDAPNQPPSRIEWKEYWRKMGKDENLPNCENAYNYWESQDWKRNGRRVDWKKALINNPKFKECPTKEIDLRDPAIIAKVPQAFIQFCKEKWGDDKKQAVSRWKHPQDGPTYRKIHYFPDPNHSL
jgi:hypothetical protein